LSLPPQPGSVKVGLNLCFFYRVPSDFFRKEAPEPKLKGKQQVKKRVSKVEAVKWKGFVPGGNSGGKSHHVNVKCPPTASSSSHQYTEFKFQDGDSSSHKIMLKQLDLLQRPDEKQIKNTTVKK